MHNHRIVFFYKPHFFFIEDSPRPPFHEQFNAQPLKMVKLLFCGNGEEMFKPLL